jgi:hypothetical protein
MRLNFQHIRGNRGGCGMFLHGVAFLSWNQQPQPKSSREQYRSSIFNILLTELRVSGLKKKGLCAT